MHLLIKRHVVNKHTKFGIIHALLHNRICDFV